MKTTIVLILIILGVMYFVKDEKGVSYLESTYNKVHYYAVERGQDAIEKANVSKNVMQKQQDKLQKDIDSL